MQFPGQNLTSKYISSSYQDIVQIYRIGNNNYLLDGFGNLIDLCDISASISISSSFATTASYAANAGGIVTGQTYNITSSWSQTSSYSLNSSGVTPGGSYNISSSYASSSLSSSYSLTASYAMNGGGSGVVAGGSYNISSSYASSSLSSSYILPDNIANNYSSSVSSLIGLKQNTLTIGGNYTITSSWATSSISSSYIDAGNITTGILNNNRLPTQITINGITGSLFGTSSYSNNADTLDGLHSSSFQATLINGGNYNISSSYSPVDPAYSASVSSVKQNALTNTLYTLTASLATSASYYPSFPTNILSSSFASSSLSSSYILPDNIANNYSSSVSSLINNKQDNLVIGNTYNITSSWSNKSISSSYAPVDTAYSASISSVKQNTLTNTLYTLTASLATSASYYPAFPTNILSSSFASSSLSSSYILPGNIASNYSSSVSSLISNKQDTLVTGNNYTITSSWASSSLTASYILPGNIGNNYSSSVSSLIGTKQNTLTNTLYTITSSLATSASYYPAFPTNILSASFASSSLTASYAISASWSPNTGGGTTLVTSSTYPITSSWANNVIVSNTSFYSSQSKWSESSSFASSSISSSYLNGTASYINFNSLQDTTGNTIYASESLLKYGGSILNVSQLTKEPTGFISRTDSSMSFDDATKTFKIQASGSSYFKIYSIGKEYIKTGSAIVLTPTTGSLTYIFYDHNTLELGTSVSEWNFLTGDIPVATLYWSASGLIGDERHGIIMDGATHEYIHDTIGARYGYGLTGTFTSGTGSFLISSGEYRDEDIEHVIPNSTTNRILYRNGTAFTFTNVTNSYYLNSGGGTPRAYYDLNGVLTPLTQNVQYAGYFIIATNNPGCPIYSIMGQRLDTSLANARLNNTYESLVFGNSPFKEMKLLYRVLIPGNSFTAGTTVDVTDYRTVSSGPGGTFVATSHGSLTGLNVDDHGQYLLLTGRGGQTINDQVTVNGITSSLYGTSSWTNNSLTASYIGSGSNNYLPKWSNNTLTNFSSIYDNGTNVGIGTNNPSSQLHLYGRQPYTSVDAAIKIHNVSAGGSRTSSLVITTLGASDNGRVQFILDEYDSGDTSTAGWEFKNGVTNKIPITFKATAPDYSLYIGDTGYVGIGTNSNPVSIIGPPIGNLCIYSSNGVNPLTSYGMLQIAVGTSTNNYQLIGGVYGDSNGSWIQSEYYFGMLPLCLNPLGGNVGIGTSNPQSLLHVFGNISASTVYANLSGNATNSSTASYILPGNIASSYSASISTLIGLKQDILVNTITYNITASRSVSSSYSPVEQSYSASISSIKQDTLTNTLYTITASLATSASYYPAFPNNILSSSFASSSLSSSYILPGNIANTYSASVSTQIGLKQDTLVNTVTYNITASKSVSSSYSPVEPSYSASVSSIKQDTLTNTLYLLTASLATSASYYPSFPSNILSASFASSSLTSSYILPANIANSYSASISTLIGLKQDALVTGNTYTITSSCANNSKTSSYIDAGNISNNYSSSVSTIIGLKQDTLITGGKYTITSSWATSSISSSYIDAGNISNNYSSSVSTIIGTKQDSLVTGGNYQITSSWATSSISSSYSPIEQVYSASVSSIKQNTLITGNTYTITSSWANVSLTSSYVLPGNIANSYSSSVSTIIGTKQDSLVTGGKYSITSSWATSSISSSYIDAGNITTGILNNNRLPSQISVTGITASLVGTSSWSNNSITASYISGSLSFADATNNYIPKWLNNQLTATSSIYEVNGNVGINTTSTTGHAPARRNIIFADETNDAVLEIWGTKGQRSLIQSAVGNTYMGTVAGTGSTNITYGPVGNIAITVLPSSGWVGIGTINPSSILTINTGSPAIDFLSSGTKVAVFSANGATGEIRIGSQFASYFPTFYSANAEVMRITTAGYVGLKTTTPLTQLHISEPTTSSSLVTIGNNDGAMLMGYEQNVGNVIYNYAGKGLLFKGNYNTTPTTQMVIDSNGNVGIGTTNPQTNLHVQGNISASIISFPITSSAPSNPSTPVKWVDIIVGGTTYKTPLYL